MASWRWRDGSWALKGKEDVDGWGDSGRLLTARRQHAIQHGRIDNVLFPSSYSRRVLLCQLRPQSCCPVLQPQHPERPGVLFASSDHLFLGSKEDVLPPSLWTHGDNGPSDCSFRLAPAAVASKVVMPTDLLASCRDADGCLFLPP